MDAGVVGKCGRRRVPLKFGESRKTSHSDLSFTCALRIASYARMRIASRRAMPRATV
jgi:hypothetical protein